MGASHKEITEEYIWAMRASFNNAESDSELWKERRAKQPLVNNTTAENARKSKSSKNTLASAVDCNVKVMASLVPDEIIYNVRDYSIRKYDACLLFGDVSGFTDLCEKYNKTGKGGPSRLTQVLNSYIGSMVQEIMSHGGDVLKFSGDAFLAMWKSGPNDSMQDAVHEALDTALVIQKNYGTYETDVGVFLRVKLAISAGFVKFSLIGNEHNSHYVVVGQPIWDVKAAEHISVAGEIVVAVNAWHYVNPNEYLYEVVFDGLHVKVHGLGPNWRNTQKNVRYQRSTIDKVRDTDDNESQDETISDTESNFADDAFDTKAQNEDFLLRPAVDAAARLGLREDLRKFIIGPVMRGIDLDEPLEYLTEMRQIVILFINVVTEKISIDSFIDLVNKSYIQVFSVVEDMRGCVNKVSIFDKDLMFLVIFGLRGFKHEMESQMGLRCAVECRQSISTIEHVKTTSIAVTTGMSYCGIVGHTLRREYTVISLTVNKAARLMVAYPDRVTCDRETFLHSKLDSRNFILQEHKDLKGISNPGPVYEFREETKIQERSFFVSKFPLLGRDNEMRLYKKLLNECIQTSKLKQKKVFGLEMLNHHNMLLVQGEPRQGKTRLLNELVYATSREIPINRFLLTNRDNKAPFQTIQLMFSKVLGLHESSTEQDRERKLLQRLGLLDVPEALCALNPVFSVQFAQSTVYVKLTHQKKRVVLKKLFKQLCKACFNTLWVIAIDDGEFMDEESWGLLPVILDLDVVLILMTMGSRRILGTVAEKNINHKRVRKLNLLPIDKWYHAALACQVLEVTAIPPELEKVIQSRSNGNPGWVESFLVSLIQAGGVTVKELHKNEVAELGLVAPPLVMMQRVAENKDNSAHPEERKSSTVEESRTNIWEMYQCSFKESTISTISKAYSTTQNNMVTACLISPNFSIEDVDPELTADVLMLKIFDSLTSFEQLLLKCSSILGEFFPREMLVYLIGNASLRTTSTAIQKLFEIRVLGCAKGDFTQGDIGMVFRQRLINPSLDTGIRCECRGLKMHESCMDLPKYAFCGYLRFRMPMFRETTYNLLTDNQKKEFHNKAIRYLEKETRRCRSCGNGFFVRVLGTKHDVGLKRVMRSAKRTSGQTTGSQSRDDLDSGRQSTEVSVSGSRRISVTGSVSNRSQRAVSVSGDNVSTIINVRFPQADLVPSGCLGIKTIHRTRKAISITRTFSASDFSACQCPQILTTMYSQMLEHCEGAGQLNKLMDAMLEYAYVCIVSCNIPQAMKILDEALKLLQTKPIEDEYEASWKIPLVRGKLQTLVGQCRLEFGQLDEAFNCFHSAMRCYGFPFPKSHIRIRTNVFFKELKQNFGLFFFPNTLSKRMENYKAEFCDNLSECLSLMCILYMEINAWKEAELAAVWSLNRSLSSESNFYGLCTAYANMLQVMHHLGRQQTCIALEVHALRLCHRKTSTIEQQELKAVAKLYTAIFCSRLLRSETDHAINIAYVTLHICSSIHAIQFLLHVYPLLVQALLIKKRITDAVAILHEIEYYAEEDIDNSGRTWYFALCIVLQLETGYTLIPFKFCEKFYQVHADALVTVRDPDSEKCFYVVMWLWCVRNEEFEAATVWLTKAGDFTITSRDDSLANVFTTLYLLEGMILYIVCRVDQRNVRAVAQAYKEVESLIKSLQKTAKTVTIILPRLWHLKAYYRFVKHADSTSFTYLNRAKKYAENYKNYLELAWIEHSEKAWNNNLPSIVADFWREHCEPDNLLDYHEVDINDGKLGFFTLPTPIYTI